MLDMGDSFHLGHTFWNPGEGRAAPGFLAGF
jgi:hypothetical protein